MRLEDAVARLLAATGLCRVDSSATVYDGAGGLAREPRGLACEPRGTTDWTALLLLPHEIAHWAVATDDERRRPNWGLGPDARDPGLLIGQRVPEPTPEQRVLAADVEPAATTVEEVLCAALGVLRSPAAWRAAVASSPSTASDTPTVVCSEDLLRPYRGAPSLRLPPGRLRVACEPDADGRTSDPGLLDLGGRAAVEYVEEADV